MNKDPREKRIPMPEEPLDIPFVPYTTPDISNPPQNIPEPELMPEMPINPLEQIPPL